MSDFKQQVETLGNFFQQRNMTPMEGRVFALLLLSDPHYQDFFSIQRKLGVSKSAVSNAINRLITTRRIDHMKLPGDRKRYFKVNPDLWLEQMKAEISSVGPLMTRLDTILEARADMNSPEFNQKLRRIRRFYAFLADEFPQMIAKWERLEEEAGY